MHGNIDHSWGGDGLRERKNTQHETYETYETHEEHESQDEHGDQGNDAGSEDLSREKELRKKKKTIGKTPDGSGE